MIHEKRIKAYKKFLRAVLQLCAALFELITLEEAPGYNEVLSDRVIR
jgi:hypothetical protein